MKSRPKQQTTPEVLESLLGLVGRKFYDGDPANFAKDRRNLLQWVILWPARHFFDERAVSVTPDRYRELMTKILMDAVVHQAQKIRYRPAWLMQVVQSHFRIHGEEIYEAAKSARTLSEHALLTLGKLPARPQDDLVSSFTTASRLLDKKKPSRKAVGKEQLNLL